MLDKLISDLPEELQGPVQGMLPDVAEFARRVAAYKTAQLMGASPKQLEGLLGDVWTQKTLMVQRAELAMRDVVADLVAKWLPRILTVVLAA